jgi:rubrerythrin
VGVPTLEKAYKNSFLVFLEDLIRNESRISLILLIQVILEGWGIVYYSKLANYALQPEVRDTLKQIVADESSHHGSGITLFKDAQLKEEDELRIAPKIIELLSMLRCGPLGVLSSLYHEMGGMNKTQIKTYLQETGADQKINEDLLLMKQLLTKASAQHIVKAVEEKGLWETPTLDECAQNLAIVLGARA